MLLVISPAKTLDYETPPVTPRHTQPQFLDHAQELIQQLRELSPAQIAELMQLSDKLADQLLGVVEVLGLGEACGRGRGLVIEGLGRRNHHQHGHLLLKVWRRF